MDAGTPQKTTWQSSRSLVSAAVASTQSTRMIEVGLRGWSSLQLTATPRLCSCPMQTSLDVGRELTPRLGAGANPEVASSAEDHSGSEGSPQGRRYGLRDRW